LSCYETANCARLTSLAVAPDGNNLVSAIGEKPACRKSATVIKRMRKAGLRITVGAVRAARQQLLPLLILSPVLPADSMHLPGRLARRKLWTSRDEVV